MGNRSLEEFLDAGDGGDDADEREDSLDGATDPADARPRESTRGSDDEAGAGGADDGPADGGTSSAGGEPAGQRDGEPQSDPAGEHAPADPTETDAPQSATYAFEPTGGRCVACGGSVERRWQAAEGLVCPDCKEW